MQRYAAVERRLSNLPTSTTKLIGREKETHLARKLLNEETRLLTLTGPGGTGKTALGLEVARTLVGTFPDGVFLAPLAHISDPTLVIPTITGVLGLKDDARLSHIDVLKNFLGDKQMLLVLDNFEQVVAAAPQIADLMASCPRPKFLVTSREALRIHGEREFPVPPLPLPNLKQLPSLAALAENEAVSLFVERAHAVKLDFGLTEDNAHAVSEICVQLDGLPLALELAAARIKILTPQSMLDRLGDRLGLLTGGERDVPARQQTLRGTIAWSYDLLDEDEKKLFRRLAVFVGGFTLEAAVLCNAAHDLSLSVLDGLNGLVNRNLLKLDEIDGESRFSFLETIREFALGHLKASPDLDAMRRGHLNFFLGLAEKSYAELYGPDEVKWLSRFDQENENLRAALRWITDSNENELSLRLAGALGNFWIIRGYDVEGRGWLSAALKNAPSEATKPKARALITAGTLASAQGDTIAGRELLERALTASRELEFIEGTARSLRHLGELDLFEGEQTKGLALLNESLELFRRILKDEDSRWIRVQVSTALNKLGGEALSRGDYERAVSLFDESLVLRRKIGSKSLVASSLRQLARLAVEKDRDFAKARGLCEESLVMSGEVGNKNENAWTLAHLGDLDKLQERYNEAAQLYGESLQLFEDLGDRSAVSFMHLRLGQVALRLGNDSEAHDHFNRSLDVLQKVGAKSGVAVCLAGFGEIAAAKHEPGRAAKLFGASQAILERLGRKLEWHDRVEYEYGLSLARTQLGEEKLAAALTEGRSMTHDQAVAYALAG